MEKQLDNLVDTRVYVVKPLTATASLSFMGKLERGIGNNYYLSGNPSILFNVVDVLRIDVGPGDTNTVRLTN